MKRTVVEALASSIQARINCVGSNNDEWREKHEERIEKIARECLPSGSGIDAGCSVILEESTANKIVLSVPFHHMNDDGMYIGWITYRATARPSFIGGMTLHLEAINPFEIADEEDPDNADYFECMTESTMDYLADVLSDVLATEIDEKE